MQDWIVEEVEGVDLNDRRLNKRFARLLDCLSARPNVSIPGACHGEAETNAAYRFFDNDKVSPEKLLAPHVPASVPDVRAFLTRIYEVVYEQETGFFGFKNPVSGDKR